MGSLVDRSLDQAAFAARPGAARHRCLLLRLRPAARQAGARRGGRRSRSATTSRRLRLADRLPDRARRRRLRRDLRRDRLHRPGRADLRAAADRRPSRPGDPAGGADRRAAAARRRPRRAARAARPDAADRRRHRLARRALLPLAGRPYALAAQRDEPARRHGLAHRRAGCEPTSLTLEAGKLICLIGPNGSGKTSLLHALAGIGAPAGEVRIDGVDPRRLRPGAAAAPADLSCRPSRDIAWPLPARDLIALGGEAGDRGRDPGRARARAVRRPAGRPAVDRRAQPGADRPGAGAAARSCCCSTSRPPISIRSGRSG